MKIRPADSERSCPTPSKRAFRSQEAAQDRADEVIAQGGDELEPYECPCQEWHLRNPHKYAGKNAFHAKQRARRAELRAARDRERAALGLDLFDIADEVMAAMGLSDVTQGAPNPVTHEYGSADPPGGD